MLWDIYETMRCLILLIWRTVIPKAEAMSSSRQFKVTMTQTIFSLELFPKQISYLRSRPT